MPRTYLNRETVTETFRQAVLAALDETAATVFRRATGVHDAGASDADLPSLFKAIDEQVTRLGVKYSVDWEEDSDGWRDMETPDDAARLNAAHAAMFPR